MLRLFTKLGVLYVSWSLAYPVRVITIPKALNENDIDVQVLNNHTFTYLYVLRPFTQFTT
jgi:hypothetical protein